MAKLPSAASATALRQVRRLFWMRVMSVSLWMVLGWGRGTYVVRDGGGLRRRAQAAMAQAWAGFQSTRTLWPAWMPAAEPTTATMGRPEAEVMCTRVPWPR